LKRIEKKSEATRFLNDLRTDVEVYFLTSVPVSPIDGSLRIRIVILSRMKLLLGTTLSIVASIVPMVLPVTARAQVTSADAESLQKKASEAQARIQANKDDRDQLMTAVKTNEVASAKEVLLRNGFTAEDLENAKITLRTGGGKGGKDEIEISATCCDPKEITIQRSLENFTK
jgi:hypothetical protein